MKAGRLIVTSCGTSLLTNGAAPAVRSQLISLANCRRSDGDAEAEALIAARAKLVGRRLSEVADIDAARALSAEINSLIAFEASEGPLATDHHILVHTDTLQGEATANLVGDWLQRGGRVVRLMTVPGLRTADLDEFRAALADLAKVLVDEIPGWRDRGASVHFNLTGGFKGMQGFLQALGFVLADEVLYLFEGSKALLRIPRLPLTLAADSQLLAHFNLLRRLAYGEVLPETAVRDLPETLTLMIDNEAVLSPWGQALFAELTKTGYRKRLLEPISSRLSFGRQFIDAVDRLPPDRLAQINRQLDRFAAYLEAWRPLAKSLGFKALKGDPVSGLTHEIYAWSDRDAARMFGRYLDDGQFSIEHLGPHL